MQGFVELYRGFAVTVRHLVLLAVLAGCVRGPAFMDQAAGEQPTDVSSKRTPNVLPDQSSGGEQQQPAPVAVAVVANEDGAFVATLSKDSTTSQVITPPAGTNVGGFSASIPAGALAV